jgi:hypothetical protein
MEVTKMPKYVGSQEYMKFWRLPYRDRTRVVKEMKKYLSKRDIQRKFNLSDEEYEEFADKSILVKDVFKGQPTNKNMMYSIYFKLEEYGGWGHFIWINCRRSIVVSPETTYDEIIDWEYEAKSNMLEEIADFMGGWIYDADYTWGSEVESSMMQEGVEDYSYKYSHDGNAWREFTT